MIEILSSPEAWLSLLMLSTMEVVLGVDNLIFISILASRLPEGTRARARRVGLMGAFVTRLGLLGVISWIVGLTAPWFTVLGREFSGKSFILFAGGLFLLYKATTEIHHKLEGEEQSGVGAAAFASFAGVILQIMTLGKAQNGSELALTSHRAIIAALAKGDRDALQRELSDHMGLGLRYLAQQKGTGS